MNTIPEQLSDETSLDIGTALPEALQSQIYGIGTDIVAIKRIQLAIERTKQAFIDRVYSQEEVNYCQAAALPFERFAASWAAKEAAVKALGTGFREMIRFTDIELVSNAGQRPILKVSGRFQQLMTDRNIKETHVSVSHDATKALAFVVLCH